MSRLLSRLPAFATVGVGSLPFIDERPAVRQATRAYDVPFCPQLPALDGDMITEWLGAEQIHCGWSSDRDRQEPRAWPAFVAAVSDRPPPHAVVKLQVTGPLTLAAGLVRADGGHGKRRDARALALELATWLAANAAHPIRALRARGLDTLLIVDEPGLALLDASAADTAVWDPLRAAAPAWGLHICGPVPWRLIDIAEPDVISYDLVRYGQIEAAGALARLIDRGGRVAFGALDATDPTGAPDVAGRVWTTLAAIAERTNRDAAELAAQSLLSPSCGTGRLSGQRERLISAELGAASFLLRDAIASPRASALTRHRPRPQSTGTS